MNGRWILQCRIYTHLRKMHHVPLCPIVHRLTLVLTYYTETKWNAKMFSRHISSNCLFAYFRSPEVHMKAVNSIRCLLTSHDVDIRYQDPDIRSRVANLYLPLIAIIIDNLPKLYSWSSDGEVRIVGSRYQFLQIVKNSVKSREWKIQFHEFFYSFQ